MRLTRVTNVVEERPAPAGARLRVLAGPEAGTSVVLPAIGLVVGADPSVDLVLSDEAVSGRHCAIAPADGSFEVRDLGSRNGTFIDDVKVDSARVPVGAQVRVGRTVLQLLPAEEYVDIPPSDSDSFGSLIGQSLPMRQVFAVLERACSSSAPVLFLGESGTGKELAARAVHERSPRREGPFVVFDCGAASASLIEGALFGHLRGAFTGAVTDRAGAFAAAHGGTLFLDEIGDLPVELQPKLLRMLESGQVTPLGTHAAETYDVRIVAATHRDLFEEVALGGFRGDLYYRLAVVEVQLPPLRRRLDDLPGLVALFLERSGSAASEIRGANLDKLMSYHWPGNIRELRNVITRAVALSGPGASFADMPILLRSSRSTQTGIAARADRPFHDAKNEVIAEFERTYLADLLARHGDNLSQAARVAGLERKYLYRLLERAGLRRKR